MLNLANIWGWIVVHKRIVLVCACFLVVLVLVASLLSDWGQPSLNHEEIQRLQRENERIERERLDNTLQRIDNGRVETNENAKRAEEESANVNRRDYSNTNLDAANAARCKAFPERCR